MRTYSLLLRRRSSQYIFFIILSKYFSCYSNGVRSRYYVVCWFISINGNIHQEQVFVHTPAIPRIAASVKKNTHTETLRIYDRPDRFYYSLWLWLRHQFTNAHSFRIGIRIACIIERMEIDRNCHFARLTSRVSPRRRQHKRFDLMCSLRMYLLIYLYFIIEHINIS